MTEMVSSAVVQETVSQVLSGLVQKHKEKEESNASRNLERLEMSHIRLGAALETSAKWQINDASLLRWRRKLKRAAQECDDTLHKCKQRIQEHEQMEQEVRNSSLSNRIVHATKSFVFSVFNRDNNELSRSIVQRFEWYADGASEFLRFIELGGTPTRRHMPFDSLVKNLFAGKELHLKIIRGNEYPSFQLWLVPYSNAKYGTEASLLIIQKDGTPEGTISFSMLIQISESTDIVGIAIKCLQFVAPHFKCRIENIRKELTQLPTQVFSWVPSVYTSEKEHWGNLHSFSSQWCRPNALCCKEHDQLELRHINNLRMAGLADVSLEPVIEFDLQCQIPFSVYNKQKTSGSEDMISLQGSPYLIARISFAPHASSEDILPANRSSEIATIVGEEQHCSHTDITFEQLEAMVLPKAVDYFHQNAKATVYQMIWSSKHGAAIIQAEKASMGTRRTFGGGRITKLLQGQDQERRSRRRMAYHLLDLWRAHVPVRLQSLLTEWMQKEKEIKLAEHRSSTSNFKSCNMDR